MGPCQISLPRSQAETVNSILALVYSVVYRRDEFETSLKGLARNTIERCTFEWYRGCEDPLLLKRQSRKQSAAPRREDSFETTINEEA